MAIPRCSSIRHGRMPLLGVERTSSRLRRPQRRKTSRTGLGSSCAPPLALRLAPARQRSECSPWQRLFLPRMSLSMPRYLVGCDGCPALASPMWDVAQQARPPPSIRILPDSLKHRVRNTQAKPYTSCVRCRLGSSRRRSAHRDAAAAGAWRSPPRSRVARRRRRPPAGAP